MTTRNSPVLLALSFLSSKSSAVADLGHPVAAHRLRPSPADRGFGRPCDARAFDRNPCTFQISLALTQFAEAVCDLIRIWYSPRRRPETETFLVASARVLLDRLDGKTHAAFRRDHHVHMTMTLVDPDLHEMPVRIVFSHLLRLRPNSLQCSSAVSRYSSGYFHQIFLFLSVEIFDVLLQFEYFTSFIRSIHQATLGYLPSLPKCNPARVGSGNIADGESVPGGSM